MDKVKEQTILDGVGELEELLRILQVTIDYLVSRNPNPDEMTKAVEAPKRKEDNVFDEILNTLAVCKGLTREATERIQAGISQKVQ